MPPKRTQQPPRRRSRRLAGLDPEWPVLAVRAKVRIDAYRQKKEKYNENLARTMHAFIDFLPEGGCQSVARDIVGCANDGELFAVFKKLYTGLLFPMIASKRHPPIYTSSAEKLRQQCLRRDNNRCIITQSIDTTLWNSLERPPTQLHAPLEVAYLIPSCYSFYRDTDIASEIWEILYRYFPEVRKAGMDPDRIDHPSNAVVMSDFLHMEFKGFRFVFEATDEPHVYHFKPLPSFTASLRAIQIDEIVRFDNTTTTTAKNDEEDDIPLPNPVFLNVHCTVAEIFEASDIEVTIDQQLRDIEDNGWCLAKDGWKDGGGGLLTSELWGNGAG